MSESSSFDAERERAQRLLADEDLTALHLGVIHDDDTVDTVVSRRTDGDSDEGLQALSLLATHLRAVASEAGVDYETVAADAATVAAELEELPVEAGSSADTESPTGTKSPGDTESSTDTK